MESTLFHPLHGLAGADEMRETEQNRKMSSDRLGGRTLSPRQVAQALGVSESTLKRSADRHELHVFRTSGGHRRISYDEALRFARQRGLPVLQPEVLGLHVAPPAHAAPGNGCESLADHLSELLMDDQLDAARALLLNAFAGGTPIAELCDGPIRECLRRFGEYWDCNGDAGICIEHAATDLMTQALNRMRSAMQPHPDAPTPPVAVGGSPTDDPYSLPSLMASTVMTDCGYRGINLGTHTPLFALRDAVPRYRPRVVWLASSGCGAHPDPEELEALAEAAAEAGAALLVGGRGFEAAPPRLSAPHAYLPTMVDLARAARALRYAQAEGTGD